MLATKIFIQIFLRIFFFLQADERGRKVNLRCIKGKLLGINTPQMSLMILKYVYLNIILEDMKIE